MKRRIPPYLKKILISKKKLNQAKKKRALYTENWDDIRRKVYQRDNYCCVLCGKRGKVHAHHIVPVAVSHDNSLSNLVSLCNKCHRKLEAIGYKILEAGGHRTDVRKIEFKMILEAKKNRANKLQEKINDSRGFDETTEAPIKTDCELDQRSQKAG